MLHYELPAPDPQALLDVLVAHEQYDPPNAPVILDSYDMSLHGDMYDGE